MPQRFAGIEADSTSLKFVRTPSVDSEDRSSSPLVGANPSSLLTLSRPADNLR